MPKKKIKPSINEIMPNFYERFEEKMRADRMRVTATKPFMGYG